MSAGDDIATLAVEAIDLLQDAAAQIPPECWDTPSNLADWSLRDLVAHATGSAAKIVALLAGEDLGSGPSQPVDWMSADPVARLRELAVELRALLPGADLDSLRPSPQGDVPLRRALAFPVADLALHSWDIHFSQGRQTALPADLLAFSRGLVESVPDEMLRRPGGFGPAQPVPDDATPTVRLMTYLGRAVPR